MTTEEMLAKAQQNQQSLIAKRSAIIIRLQSLKAEIDAASEISDYAKQRADDTDTALNLHDKVQSIDSTIALVKTASLEDLEEWERRANCYQGGGTLEEWTRSCLTR